MARWNEGDKRGGKSKQAVARCLDLREREKAIGAHVWVRHEYWQK